MTVTESIQQYTQKLPTSLQLEVLDFVKYLLFKKEQEIVEEPDELVWSSLSLDLAMRGMENENAPLYTFEDLQEVFS
jgi:hypothetical protein